MSISKITETIGKILYRLNKKYDSLDEPWRFLIFFCASIKFILFGTHVWGLDLGPTMGIMLAATVMLPLRAPYIHGWLNQFKD